MMSTSYHCPGCGKEHELACPPHLSGGPVEYVCPENSTPHKLQWRPGKAVSELVGPRTKQVVSVQPAGTHSLKRQIAEWEAESLAHKKDWDRMKSEGATPQQLAQIEANIEGAQANRQVALDALTRLSAQPSSMD